VSISLDTSGPLPAEPLATVPRGARLAAGFIALSVLVGTAGGVMQLGVPLLAMSRGATNAQVNLVRSVGGLGMLLVVIPIGFLVDRLGARRVFRAGALAGAAIAVVYATAPPSFAVILLMALEGLFAPLRFTALTASFYGRLSSIGIEKAGWFKASMSAGLTFLGPLIGGLLARGAGFPALFGVVAAVHLLSASLAATVELEGARAHPGPAAGARLADKVASLRAMLRAPSIRPALAAELLGAATFSAFGAFVLVVAVRVHGADPAVASRILIVEGLSFVVTAFQGGRFASDRPRLRRVAGLAGALGAVGTALAPGPVSLALAGVAIGVATGLVHVFVASWIASLDGAKGRVTALFQVAAGLGVTLGPLATALAGRWIPAQGVLLVFLLPFLLLAVGAAGARAASARHRDRPLDASGATSRHPGSTPMALERQQVPQYLNDTRFIILSTVGPANSPATRALGSFAADGLTVYFSTGRTSDKVGQIAANPNVSILFQHERQEVASFANVEIRGVAEVLACEEERAKAIRLISLRNPRFKERAEKGELGGNALLRVTPKQVKVVDFSKGHGPAAVSNIEV
jgi:general stress protein 26/predicted MFS family arabinose efflux permease